MLTKRQVDLLDFIAAYMASEHGVSPTFEEMAAGIGVKSKSNIDRLVAGLCERGFLRRLKNRARSLEIIRMPPRSQGAIPDDAPSFVRRAAKWAAERGLG